jgi:hypothetical protein
MTVNSNPKKFIFVISRIFLWIFCGIPWLLYRVILDGIDLNSYLWKDLSNHNEDQTDNK